jgi:Lamin Tail Domain
LKRIVLTAVLCGLALLALAPAASARIKIDRIYFDSPGSDTGSNPSLNAEWIRLRNTGNRGRSLTGWRIRDRGGHVYRFGQFTLRAGWTVTVHTGSGSNTARHRYWRSDAYIWNNDGDRATLRNKAGRRVDRCSYRGTGSALNC